MVFNSLFGFKRSNEAQEMDTRDATPGRGAARSQMGSRDSSGLGVRSNDSEDGSEKESRIKHRHSISGAEARILKAVSKSSIDAADDENWSRLTGFGLGIGSLYVQEVLTYPVCIIRRQCQVNHAAFKHHLTPFTIFQLMLKIQQKQGLGALWKGWGTSCVFQGIVILTEVGISEVMNIPRDLTNEEKVGIKTVIGNQFLKCLGLLITLPLYSATLVDSIQSYQLNETRSVVDFLKDVLYRLAGWYHVRGHGRLLPMYMLIAPTLLHSMLRYVFKSLIETVIIQQGSTRESTPKPKEDVAIQAGKTYYIQLLAGFVSNLIADVVLYPLETIVFRLHVQGTRTIIDDTDNGIGVVPLCTNYDGMKDCALTICREEGALALFKGIGAVFLQCVIQACVLKITKSIFKRLPQAPEGSLAEN